MKLSRLSSGVTTFGAPARTELTLFVLVIALWLLGGVEIKIYFEQPVKSGMVFNAVRPGENGRVSAVFVRWIRPRWLALVCQRLAVRKGKIPF